MKKALIIISALFLFVTLVPNKLEAQQTKKQLKKTRQAILAKRKSDRKLLQVKAIKEARKKAKSLEKEGWKVFPGSLPLDKSLEKSWINQSEEKIQPNGMMGAAYIWATGNGVAKTKSAAKMQAIQLAKLDLASQLKEHITALTTTNIANVQLSSIDAETEQSIVQSAKSLASATLTQVKPTVVLFRTVIPKKELKKNNKQQLAPGTVEVQVTVFYDLYQADSHVRNAIKNQLKDQLKDNMNELEEIMSL